jgi:hypothetical protein
MFRVIRFPMFLAALAWFSTAMAQVPPGVAYNPKQHPNPIATYVKNPDFKVTTFAIAQKRAGFELLGLSEKEGKRTSISLADPMPASQKIELPNDDYPMIKVEFYPVVRQTYVLTGGGELTLDVFRFPKVPLPLNLLSGILNYAAFLPGNKFWKARFGPAATPEQTMVRGVAALLFDDNQEFVVFWREGEQCYIAKSKTNREDLFRVIEDLL